MTREEWTYYRKQYEIPIEVWFNFYRDRGGTIDDLQVFTVQFHNIIPRGLTIKTNNWTKEVTYASAIRALFNYYDNKFDL